jgi:RND family efflux transporter MFP subunit
MKAPLLIAITVTIAIGLATASSLFPRVEPPGESAGPAADAPSRRVAGPETLSAKFEGAVIRPFRQSVVAAEVQGVIDRRHFQEGDTVKSGQTVFEISPDLYETVAARAKERVAALDEAHRQLEEELKLREYLLNHDSATQQQVLKARAEEKIAAHRAEEARKDLDLSLRDVKKCKVTAPFSGRIPALYKDAYESVQRFDQLFLLADASRVYAVVNVPEAVAAKVRRGARAVFTRPSGDNFTGTVDKIEAVIDPASQTKKISVLIENAEGKLELGMLGAVRLATGSGD